MSHKQALQQIAAMDPKNYKALAVAVAIALAALQVKNLKGELAKQAKDRQRAESAIAVLERIVANPNEAYIHGAAHSELLRLQLAVANPAKLARIYRRNECV